MALETAAVSALVDITKQLKDTLAGRGALALGGDLRERGKTAQERATMARRDKLLRDQHAAYEELIKQLKASDHSLEDLQATVEHGSMVFDRALAEGFKTSSRIMERTTRDIDLLPQAFANAINQAGSDFTKRFAGEIQTLEDVFATQEKFEQLPQVAALMEQFQKGERSLELTETAIRELGFTGKETNEFLSGFSEIVDEASNRIKDNNKARKVVKNRIQDLSKETVNAQKALAKLGSEQAGNPLQKILKAATEFEAFGFSIGKLLVPLTAMGVAWGKAIFDGTQAALKFGTELDIVAAAAVGMDFAELAETQARYRNTILAATGGFDHFNSQLEEGADRLIQYTGDLSEAARVTAHLMEANLRLGGSVQTQAKFMDDQTAMFATMNNVLGMTGEQFRELNNQLINDIDIRAGMFKLNKEMRAQRFQQIQQNIVNFRLQGMLQEQAVELAKHFERLRGEDPMDRIRRAFRTRALMGALGVAGGAETARAIIAGPRAAQMGLAGVEEEAALRTQERMAEIQQRGLRGEMFGALISEQLGLKEQFGARGFMVNAILEQGQKSQKAIVDQMKETQALAAVSNETAGQMLGTVQEMFQLMKAGKIGTAATIAGPKALLDFFGVVGPQEVTTGGTLLGLAQTSPELFAREARRESRLTTDQISQLKSQGLVLAQGEYLTREELATLNKDPDHPVVQSLNETNMLLRKQYDLDQNAVREAAEQRAQQQKATKDLARERTKYPGQQFFGHLGGG